MIFFQDDQIPTPSPSMVIDGVIYIARNEPDTGNNGFNSYHYRDRVFICNEHIEQCKTDRGIVHVKFAGNWTGAPTVIRATPCYHMRTTRTGSTNDRLDFSIIRPY